ncbi:EAL domain, c-di-GMP-specific phosphodiesterase class I (or its enzymatically inactive variant) [Succinivibrio dextrinosolvens DSM 3072]|uniref:EAL domain, c-di-GMP-specific phosphodiesterase class I (Or its enzymatically inactive variant) n=1 Tax=Succinivibrio dextrinosolvens DSM 3072 TaxID=1123324 RepID=A0A1T4V4D4_9GAMM|nr:EAL domain-containing protein [Succinivibrio dextrinosolvens]SKA59747.1 EAL domain, c-di-GMP-specific phosphodiesterase class I (or its enzymatically inactive variant) [Succinivibrio dextrinosolvens DSM 3072]
MKDKDTLSYISPDVFIPIAEKKGLISQLGDRVMNKVCSFVRKYNLDKQSFVGVGVNLSGFQLQDPSLPYRLHQSVKNYDISTKFINFEITETIAVHSRNAVIAANIEKLKKMGYKFSMDDFGTGYSNFSNMSSINYDLVKIDKSMIWQAFDGKNRKSMTVLISIINMIHSIGCTVVAEGIETESQAEFLRECGIEFLQGFFFSKPLSEDSFLEYLSKMDDESVVSELNILKK